MMPVFPGEASGLGDGCGVKDHLVVGDAGLPVDQKTLVLRIEDCPLDIIAGEAANRCFRFPEREDYELRAISFNAAERERPSIPLGLPKLGQAGVQQILHVRVGVVGAGCTAPGPSDHIERLRSKDNTSKALLTGACYRSMPHLS